MEQGKILTYDEVAKYPAGTSEESLVDATKYSSLVKAQYIKPDMMAVTGPRIPVRDTVARKLSAVAKDLVRRGYVLNVVYGYRSLTIQQRYFNSRKSVLAQEYPGLDSDALDRLTHNFVAVPSVSGHPTGGAVDVTLLSEDGKEVDMGSKIADFSDVDKIKTFTADLTEDQAGNRQILLNAMMAQGFAPFYGEWWHFSYGDREWAAFYNNEAKYGPISINEGLVMAAGGNGTAVEVIDSSLNRRAYQKRGKILGSKYERLGAEQAGFLVPEEGHFEMAGGEFCGNAARVAAVLLAQLRGTDEVSYTVSGFDGVVEASVGSVGSGTFYVKAIFPGMDVAQTLVALGNGGSGWMVDMGGIVHIVVEADFPGSPTEYSARHRELVASLGLGGRKAVGVVWLRKQSGCVFIDPVVWVRNVDTFFYESSCGSGSIAASMVAGASLVYQPSGKAIEVGITDSAVSLASEVEVVSVFDRVKGLDFSSGDL